MKKFLKIILLIVIVFIAINIVWFSWRGIKYQKYVKGMDKTEFYTIFIPRYIKQDKDGFTYSVKFPDYLSITGNLSVGVPSENDNFYTDALIIWPNLKGYEYGLILYEKEDEYLIELNNNREPIDNKYKDIMKKHQENIDVLFKKANERWNLN